MIELHTLGSLELTSAESHAVGSVLVQPRRAALLCYLALALPRGFHRRDTLFALFWPEDDAEQARHALRQSVYFLRRALGPTTIVSRGDEELALAPEQVRCDVWEFDGAVDQGRPADALALYRGELLPGFHISAAPDFERWLDEERSRVRQLAVDAAWALAAQREREGDAAGAAEAGRFAIALLPEDETAIRRLMLLLERLGDRVAAVRAYEAFVWKLEGEYELQPSAETQALVARIRAASEEAPVASPNQRSGPSSAVGNGNPKAVQVAGSSTRPRIRAVDLPRESESPGPVTDPTLVSPSRVRRPPALVAGAVVLLLLGIAGLATLGLRLVRPNPSAPSVSPTAIAVLPFSYRGSPGLRYLSEGMVDLLSVKLEGATVVRPVDSRALLTFAGNKGVDDPRRGDLVARRFGAGLFVLGGITEAGGRLNVTARVYGTGPRLRDSFEAVAAGEGEIFELADRLARQILVEAQDEPLQFARVAGQSTTSLPALKAYLEGEREGRAGRVKTAEEALRRAVELDTSFALAYYRLAEVTWDTAMVNRALRHSDRLDEHHRGLLLALAAHVRGDHKAADQKYRQIVATHPDDAEAWAMLSWLTQEKGHLLGRAWVDAREPYERALALDPGEAGLVFSLAGIAAREGRRTDLDSLTDRFLRLNPHPYWAGNARGQHAVALGDTAGEARFVADLRTRPDPAAQMGSGMVTWMTGNLSAGRRLWRLITEPSRSVGYRVMAHVTLAKIELTNGRWNAASAELEALEPLDRAAALEHRAFYAVTRFREAPRSELVALRDSLQRWDPSSARREGDGLIAQHRGLHPYLRLYLLGLLSARLRDEPAALRYVAELERADRSSPLGHFAADKAQVIRSELMWIKGRRHEALTLLEGAQFWSNNSDVDQRGDSPFTNHFHERYARAELLYELGRYDEALPWYRALSYDLLYTGPAELRQAQIFERKGDRQHAIEHYTRFVDLWSDSDAELQPVVQQARQALARLR